MADRRSAALFAQIFETLRELSKSTLSPIVAREVAAKFWPLRSDYDFSEYQMNCDETLIELGLAKVIKPGTDEEQTVYLGGRGWE